MRVKITNSIYSLREFSDFTQTSVLVCITCTQQIACQKLSPTKLSGGTSSGLNSGGVGSSVITTMDFCYLEPCMMHGKCVSRQDRYECHCYARYSGNNCQIDNGRPIDVEYHHVRGRGGRFWHPSERQIHGKLYDSSLFLSSFLFKPFALFCLDEEFLEMIWMRWIKNF